MRFFLFLILVATRLAAETVCVPRVPDRLDPHRAIDSIEAEILKRAYLPLFASSGEDQIAKSLLRIDDKSWRVILRSDVEFTPRKGWKGTRKLNSLDVKFSLERQMRASASELLLSSSLESVHEVSPLEVRLVLRQPLAEGELKKLLSSPFGYVISEEYFQFRAKKGGEIDFFPSTRGLNFSMPSVGHLMLLPAESKVRVERSRPMAEYKFVAQKGLEISQIKFFGCQRLLLPSDEIMSVLAGSKLKYKEKKIGESVLYLLLNPDVRLSSSELNSLQEKLGPRRLKSLSGLGFQGNLFGSSLLPFRWERPTSGVKTKGMMDLYYCDSSEGRRLAILKLLPEVASVLKATLSLRLRPVERSCVSASASLNQRQSIGAVLSVTYIDDQDLFEQLRCRGGSPDRRFGFCHDHPQKNLTQDLAKGIDLAAKKTGRFFPLAKFENRAVDLFY